jgi:hypothetical protein
MSNFQIVDGLRQGTKLLLHLNKLYVFEKRVNGKTYYRCRRHRDKDQTCKASGIIRRDGQFYPSPFQDHVCQENNSTTAEVLKVRTKLRQKSLSAPGDISAIYQRFLKHAPSKLKDAPNLQFDLVKQSMKRQRMKLYPGGITEPDKVKEYLNSKQSPVSDFYLKTVSIIKNGRLEYGVILRSSKVLEKVTIDDKSFLLDATFKIVPPGFAQAFTMGAQVSGEMLLFCVLMTSKHEELYVETLQAIKDAYPTIQPKMFSTDFEFGISNAAKAVFSESDLLGCQFHFTDALNRKARDPCKLKHLNWYCWL